MRSISLAFFALGLTLATCARTAPIDAFAGEWEAYQVLPMPESFQALAKRCIVNPYARATMTLKDSGSNTYIGDLTIVSGVQVFGRVGGGASTVKALEGPCGMPRAARPLDAKRVVHSRVTIQQGQNGSSARMLLNLVDCQGDWCDGGPFDFSIPKNSSLFAHIEGHSLVMDDGESGLGDDYYHFVSKRDYAQLTDIGESLARSFAQDAADERFDDAARRLTAGNLKPQAIADWFTSMQRDVGGIRNISTVWKNAMTYPDPNDPNEYITVILRIEGDGRQLDLIASMQGLRSKLRIFHTTAIGYDFSDPNEQMLPYQSEATTH